MKMVILLILKDLHLLGGGDEMGVGGSLDSRQGGIDQNSGGVPF
jgi:hypothetical protein